MSCCSWKPNAQQRGVSVGGVTVSHTLTQAYYHSSTDDSQADCLPVPLYLTPFIHRGMTQQK